MLGCCDKTEQGYAVFMVAILTKDFKESTDIRAAYVNAACINAEFRFLSSSEFVM